MIHFMKITYRRRRAPMLATNTLAPETTTPVPSGHSQPIPLAVTPIDVALIIKMSCDRPGKIARAKCETGRIRLLST